MCEPASHNGRIVWHSNWNSHVSIKLIFAHNFTKKSIIPTPQKELLLHSTTNASLRTPLHYTLAIAKPSFRYVHVQLISVALHNSPFFSHRPITAPYSVYNIVMGGLSALPPITPVVPLAAGSRLWITCHIMLLVKNTARVAILPAY